MKSEFQGNQIKLNSISHSKLCNQHVLKTFMVYFHMDETAATMAYCLYTSLYFNAETQI